MTFFRLIVPCVFVAPVLLAATHWPQWRGDGSGVSTDGNFPIQWSGTNHVIWKTPIPGRGLSSPCVWNDRIFLTTDIEGPPVPGAQAVKHKADGEDFKHPESMGADRKHNLRVICLEARTGKILWNQSAYDNVVFDNRHRKGSYAAPTPATDGKYVFAFFGGEGLFCFDLKGNLVWEKSLGGMATMGMGPGTSPVLFGQSVIVQCDEDNGEKSFMVALKKNSGRELWKTPRKVSVSWATPILARAGDHAELIASGSENIISYEPNTGRELWRSKGLDDNAIPSPVAGHGLVFVSAGYPVKRTFAIRLGGSGEPTNPAVVWHYEKGSAYVPSPILYGEYFYLMTDSGQLTCLDALSGNVQYEAERLPSPAKFTASPVAFDGKLLLVSEAGDCFVVRAGLKHELLQKNSLGEPILASPALAGGRIYLRSETNLFCLGR